MAQNRTIIRRIGEYLNIFPTTADVQKPNGSGDFNIHNGGSRNRNRNLANVKNSGTYLPRIAQSVINWYDSIREAERPILPYRVKMQQIFQDTVLNSHVAACMERRKNLTLLRDFEIRDKSGNPDKYWTDYFKKRWFREVMLNYILDANFYGYSLISIGDIAKGLPVNPSLVPRYLVSPDRKNVGAFMYSPSGVSWAIGEPDDYHIFITTISENGANSCGYGLLLKVAYEEIFIRSNTGFNADFIEVYAQPFRVLYTDATEGAERDDAERIMRDMGSNAYGIFNRDDEVEFVTGNTGTGYKSYTEFEQRRKGNISKVILGHEDAISSVPGKLGSSQVEGGVTHDQEAASPIAQALRDVQTKDGVFTETVVNDMLIPKLQNIGISIPEGHYIYFLNDAERRAIQAEKNDTNQKFATITMTLSQAGYRVKKDYIEEVMGLPEGVVEYAPTEPPSEIKEPTDQIRSEKPFKERSKNRPGKQ